MDALAFPFTVFNAPTFNLHIRRSLFQPPPMVVFAFVFFIYFFFCSGIIYDLITETPSIGSERDPRTGAIKPVAIMAGRLNSQYIIEGITASALFSLGGASVILFDRAAQKNISDSSRTILLVTAGICLFIAYNVLGVFIRIKVPGYMR